VALYIGYITALYLPRLIPMTHAAETGSVDRLVFFLAPFSGMYIMQIWDRIYLVPDSGAN